MNKHCGLCKHLEHRTHECDERGAEKGAILTKLNVLAKSEVKLMTTMMKAARGGSKEEWESDSGARFHIFHAHAGMKSYKKASPGTMERLNDWGGRE